MEEHRERFRISIPAIAATRPLLQQIALCSSAALSRMLGEYALLGYVFWDEQSAINATSPLMHFRATLPALDPRFIEIRQHIEGYVGRGRGSPVASLLGRYTICGYQLLTRQVPLQNIGGGIARPPVVDTQPISDVDLHRNLAAIQDLDFD